MEYKTEITKQELNFINDVELRAVLRGRLQELERVFIVNANYSTIFLSISTIEGIFIYLADIYKTELKNSPKYPKEGVNQKLKKFNSLTISELYILLKDVDLLPEIDEFKLIYNLFKDYRNFIHPQKQAKKGWPIDLGHAQMALGLLNATLSALSKNIIIEKFILNKLAGNPDYDSNLVLNLNIDRTRVHSFLIFKNKISTFLHLAFDLSLPKDSLVNFVFNYVDDGNFKMLRLDNRGAPGTPNSVLHCTQKFYWPKILNCVPEKLVKVKNSFAIEVKIDVASKIFDFYVDGAKLIIQDDSGNGKDLFAEFERDLRFGFFNECGPAKLSNIKILKLG